MRRFLAALAFLLLAALPAHARFGAGDASNGSASPTLAFTSLANGNTSSTVAGSGTYGVSAPSNLTSATWGGGCSGSSTVSGFSAGGGTWSATFTTPSSAGVGCTLAVTGTGSNTASATSPGVTISSSSGTTFTALHTYYIATTGNDANNGTSAGTPWLTPNHAVVCGDVIIAAPGAYAASGFPTFGAVSTCPSTSGGIDGTGGIYLAAIVCNGTDLSLASGCSITYTGAGWATDVKASNWAIEDFTITGASGKGAFSADGAASTIHHVAFVNDVAYNVMQGFTALDNGSSHDVPGATGFDYVAFVGDIAQNAEQNTVCTAAMPMAGPATIDSNSGTHFLWYGNFAWNQGNNGCGSDIEDFMMDTPDAHGVTNDVAFINNVGWSAYRFGMQLFMQNFNSIAGLHEYVETNTLFNNNLVNGGGNGELNIQMNNSGAPVILAINNIAQSTQSTECGALVGGSNGASGTLASITTGTTGNENFFFNSNGGSNTCAFNTFSFGTHNFTVTPSFTNTTDLLNNRTGAPTLTGFATTTAAMGYNVTTATLTTPSVISDLTPTASNTSGKGYQLPSANCAANALFPTWLKGIVRLGVSGGSTIMQYHDLVTTPCGL